MHGTKAFAARTSRQPSLREQGNGLAQRDPPADHQPPAAPDLEVDVQGESVPGSQNKGLCYNPEHEDPGHVFPASPVSSCLRLPLAGGSVPSVLRVTARLPEEAPRPSGTHRHSERAGCRSGKGTAQGRCQAGTQPSASGWGSSDVSFLRCSLTSRILSWPSVETCLWSEMASAGWGRRRGGGGRRVGTRVPVGGWVGPAGAVDPSPPAGAQVMGSLWSLPRGHLRAFDFRGLSGHFSSLQKVHVNTAIKKKSFQGLC